MFTHNASIKFARVNRACLLLALLVLAACGEHGTSDSPEPAAATPPPGADSGGATAAPGHHAYFGAVHVHTQYSFDAFTNGTVSTPADAYAWARGQPIPGARGGPMMQLTSPLDFYAVSDHAEWMGVFRLMGDPTHPLSKHPMAARITSDDANEAMQAFAELLRNMSQGQDDPALSDPAVSRSVWSDISAAADAAYEPGVFTTFAAFEWSSNPEFRNLHRVVVFRDTQTLPELAFSSQQSTDPEDLWAWMDAQRAAGSTLTAIPHNGNASDGLMFSLAALDGEALDAAYAETRSRNEQLYEISQIKGTSETHPELSPNDEFAGFEQWDYTLSADARRPTNRRGSFARQALLDGLSQAATGNGNPFRYGFIGDTDTHNAAASHEEFNYTGKFAFEIDPHHRIEGLAGQPESQTRQVREFSSGGLAGVWAEANTREAIYDAMVRRETFGTSGPKMKVRLFAGWDFSSLDIASADWPQQARSLGVPMGGTLGTGPADRKPLFLVWGLKDPDSGNLDRIQLVKGWVDADGSQHEQVFDVTWSGARQPGEDGRLPPVGNTVDVASATYENSIGAAELAGFWVDESFDPTQHAFYYLRLLEIPTPRWSTRDAVRLGVAVPDGLPVSIQERAWSSPIWYSP